MASEVNGVSLNRLFGRAAALVWSVSEPWPGFEYLALREDEALPSRAPSSADGVVTASEAAVEAVSAAAAAADAAGVISRNDVLDDIPTRSLRFLFLPLMESYAHAAWQGSAELRLEKLIDGKRLLREFFEQMDRLGLLAVSDRVDALDEIPERTQTPQQKRDALIARHRAEKMAVQNMTILLERRKRDLGAAENDDDEPLEEEHERIGLLNMLESAVRRGLDAVRSIDREIEVLTYAIKTHASGRDPREEAWRARRHGSPPRLNGLPHTFRIVNKRDEARRNVFRPDTSIPTYTVEEWGQIEMQRALEAEKEKQSREEIRAKTVADLDSDGEETVDKDTYEKRRWDDWKDEHNKGSGNTLR